MGFFLAVMIRRSRADRANRGGDPVAEIGDESREAEPEQYGQQPQVFRMHPAYSLQEICHSSDLIERTSPTAG